MDGVGQMGLRAASQWHASPPPVLAPRSPVAQTLTLTLTLTLHPHHEDLLQCPLILSATWPPPMPLLSPKPHCCWQPLPQTQPRPPAHSHQQQQLPPLPPAAPLLTPAPLPAPAPAPVPAPAPEASGGGAAAWPLPEACGDRTPLRVALWAGAAAAGRARCARAACTSKGVAQPGQLRGA